MNKQLDKVKKKRREEIDTELKDLAKELFNILDPEYVNKISDTHLDSMRETVHYSWQTRGSKENDKEAIGAGMVVNNEYKLRGRELPNKDRFDKILEGINSNEYIDERERIEKLAKIMIADKLSGLKSDISGYSKNEIARAEDFLLDYYRWEKRPENKKTYREEQYKVNNEDYLGGINTGIEELKETRKRMIEELDREEEKRKSKWWYRIFH